MARRTPSHSQLDLFASPAPPALPSDIGPAAVAPVIAAVASALPPHLYLGTSSWAFPGWQGLVYDRAAAPGELARHGLAAYAQHPLLRTVCLDRTFYAPLPAADLATYAAVVPADFRFVVKAHAWCTQPVVREARRTGPHSQIPNAYFLNPDYATEHVVQPCLAGLGDKAGPIVFQFSPMDVPALGGPQRFAARLHAFLAALPRGPLYAVEVRNASLLTPAYRAALTDLGVCHCFNIHPSMSALREQSQVVALEDAPALIIRWMLHPARRYEEAKTRYQPFNRIVDDDLHTRQAIATMCGAALATSRAVFVIANNKAEGSAPCSVSTLAACLVQATASASAL